MALLRNTRQKDAAIAANDVDFANTATNRSMDKGQWGGFDGFDVESTPVGKELAYNEKELDNSFPSTVK